MPGGPAVTVTGGGPVVSLAEGATAVVVDGTRTIALPTLKTSSSGVGGAGSTGQGGGEGGPAPTSTGGMINEGLGLGPSDSGSGRVVAGGRVDVVRLVWVLGVVLVLVLEGS